MLMLSQYQLDVVDRGDPTLLVMHLEQRHRLWLEYESLEEQLAPHKDIPPERRVWKSADERLLTELTLNRCQELLEKIMANDQISLAKAEELKNKVEQDLRRVQVARTAAPAYARQSQMLR